MLCYVEFFQHFHLLERENKTSCTVKGNEDILFFIYENIYCLDKNNTRERKWFKILVFLPTQTPTVHTNPNGLKSI
jgi:hypothetical protein